MHSDPIVLPPADNNPTKSTFKADLLASLVVFMVALPLCIAIARACELPAEVGIITGIIGGLIVGPLAGSPLQVSGPAAGLIVLVLDFINARTDLFKEGASPYSAVAALGVVILIAGLLQLAMAAMRLGPWFRAVSPAVVLGMLGGIGVVIFVKQLHVLIDDLPDSSVMKNFAAIPNAIKKALTEEGSRNAALAGLCSLFFLVFWKKISPKSFHIIPAALIAVLAGTLMAEAFGLSIRRIKIEPNLLNAITWVTPQSFIDLIQDAAVWKMAIATALIASAETLLCATAVDQMHRGPRTNYNRELAAQGVGNTLCGILGALPMTGVIVRSSANVTAGAKTRLSATLHGLWLLLFVALLPFILERIPSACLAAVLVFTGYKLVNWKAGIGLWKENRGEALIFVITLLGVVFTDLLTGVLVGVALTVAKLVYTMSHLAVHRDTDESSREVTLVLEGAATFFSLPKLAKAIEKIPPGWTVHVLLDELLFIDHSCLQLLTDCEKQLESTGGKLVIDQDGLRSRLDRAKTPPTNGNSGQRFPAKAGDGAGAA